MNPLQILLILRAHYKIALCVALATIAIALAVTLYLPKRYTAATAVLVDVKSPDPIVAMMLPSNLATQVDIINSQRVALRVVRTLGLLDAPGVRDQWANATGGRGTPETWLADLLLRGLSVAPARESNIVNIAYTGTDPAFVAAVANGFAQAYMDVTIELKVDPARQYARWFGDQGKVMRDNLEKAQTRLSQFQQQKGIVAREEQSDTETARLNDLSNQLLKAQAETNDARLKQQQSGRAGDRLPEVRSDSVVSGLRGEILRQEAKLQESSMALGTNHPQYLRMQAEVAALRQKLADEMAGVTSAFSASSSVGSNREAVLRAAIEAQKKKLLEIRSSRDELAVLQRDVDAAKNAYDAVTKRYTESDLASQATQANVSVLTQALVPLDPSFPKPLGKTMLMAIAAGILLGAGAAFLIEMLDRRIRTTEDLVELLKLPVLGVIARAKAPRRLGLWRHRTPLLAK